MSITVSGIEIKREDGTSVIITTDEARSLYKALHDLFGEKIDYKPLTLPPVGPIYRDTWRDTRPKTLPGHHDIWCHDVIGTNISLLGTNNELS